MKHQVAATSSRGSPVAAAPPDDRVGMSRSLFYAMPAAVMSFLIFPLSSIVPGIYASHFGLSMAGLSAAVLIGKLADAVSDPLIGYFSDRYKTRTGTRKPWIVAGAVSLVASSYFLFAPAGDVTLTYFFFWYCAVFVAWTIAEVPHLAWGGELTLNSQEKTRIYSHRTLFYFLGNLAFMVIPLLPFFASSAFTPETLRISVLVTAAVVAPVVLLCVRNVPDGALTVGSVPREGIRLLLRSLFGNKPLMIFLGGMVLAGISHGMFFGMTFIFADTFLGLGEQLPLVLAISMTAGLMAVPIVWRYAHYFEKVHLWTGGQLAFAVVLAGYALLEPGPDALALFIALMVVNWFIIALLNTLYPSLLSDIADYGCWKFGTNRTATYFAAYLFLGKATIGIGSALGFAVAAWYGFDPQSEHHGETQVFGMRMAVGYLPAALGLLSLAFFVKLPIDSRRHAVIQRQLAKRR